MIRRIIGALALTAALVSGGFVTDQAVSAPAGAGVASGNAFPVSGVVAAAAPTANGVIVQATHPGGW